MKTRKIKTSKERLNLESNIKNLFNVTKQIEKLSEIKKDLRLQITDCFDNNSINDYNLEKLNCKRYYSQQKNVEIYKYNKLVNQKDFFESIKVVNSKAIKLIGEKNLDKISVISLIEKLKVSKQ